MLLFEKKESLSKITWGIFRFSFPTEIRCLPPLQVKRLGCQGGATIWSGLPSLQRRSSILPCVLFCSNPRSSKHFNLNIVFQNGKFIFLQESPLTWQALAGLNRVTDASGKELILVNINESKCLPTSAKCSRSKSIKCHPGLHKVREHYSINETLVKRWVSNQERELLGD